MWTAWKTSPFFHRQSPPLSAWVDKYVDDTGCLQIVIPFGDGSTIPGRGFCAFLLVYWTHIKLRGLPPHTINARLDLTTADNWQCLAEFLNDCHYVLGSPVIMEREINDDIILAKLQYTTNRLLTHQ
jgi:hypothetical protein